MEVGCPECQTEISASIPPGTGIEPVETGVQKHLRGTETECHSCGHELEVYFY